MKIEFIPEKTAITNGVSKGAKVLMEMLNPEDNILDYGFGKGRNIIAMSKFFKTIDGADTAMQIKDNISNIKNYASNVYHVDDELISKYSGVLCSFVLNVLEDESLRLYILKKLFKSLKVNGTMVVQVRTEKDLRTTKSKKPYKDGYAVKKGNDYTFQKGFTNEEVINMYRLADVPIKIIKNSGNNILIISNNETILNPLHGQMSYRKLSNKSDYLQLDICGLSPDEVIDKYKKYNTSLPVIIHGDWTKKGANENNLSSRLDDYIEIIKRLKMITKVHGITVHPPTRSKYTLEQVICHLADIHSRSGILPFLENRSNHKYVLSKPEEVILFTKTKLTTIDIPQMYISCGFDDELFFSTLDEICWTNVREVHIGNIIRQIKEIHGKNTTSVAQKINKGILDYSKIKPYITDVPFITYEILGSGITFEEESNIFKSL